MQPFEKEKALREELSGLGDIVLALRRRATTAESRFTEAEMEFLAITKLLGYAKTAFDQKKAELEEIQITNAGLK